MNKLVHWFSGPIEGIVEKHQAKSIVYFLIFLLLVAIILKPFASILNSEFPFLIAIALIAFLLILYKFTKSNFIVGNLVTLVLYVSMFDLTFKSGGLYSIDLAGLVLVPVIALNTAGKKSGMFWLFLCTIPIIYHYYAALDPDVSNLHREKTLTYDNGYYFLLDLVLLLLPTSLIFLYVRLNGTLLDEIANRNTKLDLANETLENQTHQLTNTKNELEVSNTLLKKYAHATSHDLKQPLRTIASFSQLLNRELQNDKLNKKKISSYLNQIEEGSIRMNSQIEEMLSFSNRSTNKLNQEIDVKKTINEVIVDLAHQIGTNKVQITIGEMPKLYGLKSSIYKIFQNLISNSIKYKDPSRDLIVNIYASEKENIYTFCVKDNGKGIPANKVDAIFDKGIQLDSGTEGSGIGLDTVQQLVKNQGGKIWVESEFGKGSNFCFTYPKQSV